MKRNSIKWFSHSGRRFIYPVGDVYGDFDINCQWWSWWCLQWWVVVGQVWMLRQLFRHKLSGSAERSQRRSPKYKLYFWLFGFGICISVWGTFPTQIVGEKSAAVAKISPENFDHIVSRPFLSKNWRNCANFQPQGPKTHLPPHCRSLLPLFSQLQIIVNWQGSPTNALILTQLSWVTMM